MPSALATLLHRSLDFAGLFPPASLPVADALRLYQQEQDANTAGMLARFVCPVLRLEDLATVVVPEGKALEISVLPRGGKNAGEFLANLETDLAIIRRLAQLHGNGIAIDTIEVRPPGDALTPAPLRKLLAAIAALLGRHEGTIQQVFVELAPSPTLASQLEVLAEQAAHAPRDEAHRIGYKLRTGGSDAASAPSAPQTAAAMAAVAALKLPMKCTGGLHRPLRAGGNGTATHGFLNLLVAAAFLSAGLAEPGLSEAILEESDPKAFGFESRAISWREHRITTAAITAARRDLLLSFGSCYAEQPRLELQKLGWWPKPSRARAKAV